MILKNTLRQTTINISTYTHVNTYKDTKAHRTNTKGQKHTEHTHALKLQAQTHTYTRAHANSLHTQTQTHMPTNMPTDKLIRTTPKTTHKDIQLGYMKQIHSRTNIHIYTYTHIHKQTQISTNTNSHT